MQRIQVTVQLSDDKKTATVRMDSGVPIVCGVLGTEEGDNGISTIYLDSKIHSDNQSYVGCNMWGAISTIIEF